MLFEVLSSAVVGSFVGYASLSVNGATNDGKKIARICSNSGLTVKEESMQLLRKSKRSWGMEYAYRIPLGLSFKDYQKRLDAIQDGLNSKSYVDIKSFLRALKTLKLRRSILRDLKDLLTEKKAIKKEVELAYDGVLIVRVYETPMPELFEFERGHFDKLHGWEVLVGVTRDQFITHDFEKVAHSLIAGSTDFGKSNVLKLWIATLIHRKPDDARFTLIDLKGGLSFTRFRRVKQVDAVAKSPDEALEALKRVQERMNEIMEDLEEKGFEDVKEAGIKERHFVIIDEAADIADNDDCVEIIIDIARRGRAAGFRLLYTTQYPTVQTIDSQIKRNCIGRLCFVLDTGTASKVVIDQEGAEKLPLLQGRAIYKKVKCTELQTPYISNKFIDEVIKPHITFRGRRDDADNVIKGATPRKHTLIIEEVGLS